MEILDTIKEFADRAHHEQQRKYTPDRYIVHPIRVMGICREYTSNEPMLAAALLHDVLEDTPTTADEIRTFLVPLMGTEKAERTLELVIELTDVFVKKDYPTWNRRKRKDMEVERMSAISPEAQTVKYADILDNCTEIVAHDRDFAEVFLRECLRLMKVMTEGNRVLYKRTMDLLETNLQLLKQQRNPS